MIFQEFIPAECDLRITAVGGKLFRAAIRSVARDGLVDFRMSVGDAELRRRSCQRTSTDKLLALMERWAWCTAPSTCAGRPTGEYYFFEVNTAGEFLFIEDRTDQPIAKAIADWLAERRLVEETFFTLRSSSALGAVVTGYDSTDTKSPLLDASIAIASTCAQTVVPSGSVVSSIATDIEPVFGTRSAFRST